MALAPAMTFAKSAAEFPTSSLMFVAACSRDWLAGLFVTRLATVRADKEVELRITGRINAAERGSGLQKIREALLIAAVRVKGRSRVFMVEGLQIGDSLLDVIDDMHTYHVRTTCLW